MAVQPPSGANYDYKLVAIQHDRTSRIRSTIVANIIFAVRIFTPGLKNLIRRMLSGQKCRIDQADTLAGRLAG